MEITDAFIGAQIFGFLTLVFSVISVQMKKRANILLLFTIAAGFAGVVYWLLEAHSGFALNMIGAVACLLAAILARKDKLLPRWALAIFAFSTIGVWALVYETPIDVTVLMAQMFYFLALAVKEPNLVRAMMMLNMIGWMFYNISVGAFVNVANNTFFLISDSIAMIRYRKVNKGKKRAKAKNHKR